MAKKSSVEKNKYRQFLVAKYAAQRLALIKILMNPSTSVEEFYEAQRQLCKLPRNSSPIRVRNRCSITGRCRSYIGKFGISRIMFRELASQGKLPGVVKSSW